MKNESYLKPKMFLVSINNEGELTSIPFVKEAYTEEMKESSVVICAFTKEAAISILKDNLKSSIELFKNSSLGKIVKDSAWSKAAFKSEL